MSTNEKTIDALTMLVNRGVVSGVEVLNTMLSSEIRPDMPSIRLIEPFNVDERTMLDDNGAFAIVEMGFNGGLKGNSGLVLPKESARRFVEKVAGDDAGSEELDFVTKGVLTEIGNIVLNRVMGSISNALDINLDYVFPNFFQGHLDQLWSQTPDKAGIVASTRFVVDDFAAEGNIVVVFDEISFSTLMSIIEEQQV